jgi:hypothetical protein
MVRLTEKTIESLIKELKQLSWDPRTNIRWKQKRSHQEFDFDVTGSDGHLFRVLLRQNLYNPMDFSVILLYLPNDSNHQFRLRRYNGLHGEHRNRIENDRFFSCHIHIATERYQELGLKEDAYAEASSEYSEVGSALSCLLSDCAFIIPDKKELPLF